MRGWCQWMFEDQLFTVISVNGSFLDAADPGTDSLRFDNLTWEEAVELAKLSFSQGFELVLWRMPEADEDEQTENAIPEESL